MSKVIMEGASVRFDAAGIAHITTDELKIDGSFFDLTNRPTGAVPWLCWHRPGQTECGQVVYGGVIRASAVSPFTLSGEFRFPDADDRVRPEGKGS